MRLFLLTLYTLRDRIKSESRSQSIASEESSIRASAARFILYKPTRERYTESTVRGND